jgi:hypothetical protein
MKAIGISKKIPLSAHRICAPACRVPGFACGFGIDACDSDIPQH